MKRLLSILFLAFANEANAAVIWSTLPPKTLLATAILYFVNIHWWVIIFVVSWLVHDDNKPSAKGKSFEGMAFIILLCSGVVILLLEVGGLKNDVYIVPFIVVCVVMSLAANGIVGSIREKQSLSTSNEKKSPEKKSPQKKVSKKKSPQEKVSKKKSPQKKVSKKKITISQASSEKQSTGLSASAASKSIPNTGRDIKTLDDSKSHGAVEIVDHLPFGIPIGSKSEKKVTTSGDARDVSFLCPRCSTVVRFPVDHSAFVDCPKCHAKFFANSHRVEVSPEKQSVIDASLPTSTASETIPNTGLDIKTADESRGDSAVEDVDHLLFGMRIGSKNLGEPEFVPVEDGDDTFSGDSTELALLSDSQDADWLTAKQYYPDIGKYEDNLEVITSKLAHSFKSYVLESKKFAQAGEIASEMEREFLEIYFGKCDEIIDLAKQLIFSNQRAAVRELNKAIRVLGPNADPSAVIPKIKERISSSNETDKSDENKRLPLTEDKSLLENRLREGKRLFDEGAYQLAIGALLPLAEGGNKEAGVLLSKSYAEIGHHEKAQWWKQN